MSQSPSESRDPSSLVRYRQGWRALNRLLHENKSFSGHEKNCAFLNLGNGQFASVSAVTGLDFADDSRAVAMCDWDFDGRQDIWLTGRTAPRLRFVHNRATSAGNYVALKLSGVAAGTNRDAIGARVEVVLSDALSDVPNDVPNDARLGPDGEIRLIRTVHAGDAFLSQSSSWLHFGLGANCKIEQVIVHWPTHDVATREQTIDGVEPNGFYLIQQGTSAAQRFQPPNARGALDPQHTPATLPDEPIRIVLPTRLPLPAIEIVAEETGAATHQKLNLPVDGPLLLNVWSVTCPVCVGELSAWSTSWQQFTEHGLNVVALNADDRSAQQQAKSICASFDAPIPWHMATAESIQSLDFFQRAMLDRWDPLPVPCSFLLDRKHQVVAIYKGAISKEQLWEDLQLIDLDAEQVRRAAIPFAGRWLGPVPSADPTAVASQMVDHRALNAAISYLGQFIDANHDQPTVSLAKPYYVRGVLLESQQRYQEALTSIRAASELDPDDFRAHLDLARLLDGAGRLVDAQSEWVAALKINNADLAAQLGLATNLLRQEKFQLAESFLQRVLGQRSDNALLHFRLGTAQRNLDKLSAAAVSYGRAIELDPQMVVASNNLAWILAAHPDKSQRDGARAVALAERACHATEFKSPQYLDTLSMAYEEAGDIAQSIETAQLAVQQMKASGRFRPGQIQPLLDRIKSLETR